MKTFLPFDHRTTSLTDHTISFLLPFPIALRVSRLISLDRIHRIAHRFVSPLPFFLWRILFVCGIRRCAPGRGRESGKGWQKGTTLQATAMFISNFRYNHFLIPIPISLFAMVHFRHPPIYRSHLTMANTTSITLHLFILRLFFYFYHNIEVFLSDTFVFLPDAYWFRNHFFMSQSSCNLIFYQYNATTDYNLNHTHLVFIFGDKRLLAISCHRLFRPSISPLKYEYYLKLNKNIIHIFLESPFHIQIFLRCANRLSLSLI